MGWRPHLRLVHLEMDAAFGDGATEAAYHLALDHGAYAGHEAEEAEHVGQDSRRDQHGSGQQNQHAVHQRAGGQAPRLQLPAHLLEHAEALSACQGGADGAGDRNQAERRKRTYVAADLDQQGQFDRRQADEEKEQAEHASRILSHGRQGPTSVELHPAMSESSEIALRVARKRRLTEEWALVLLAEGLSPSVQRAPGGFVLCVPAGEAERAESVLRAYETENRDASWRRREEPAASLHMGAGFAVFAPLIAFFFVTGPRSPAVLWFARGSADAERMLLGEPWRAVTALTLHADLGHALANSLVGTLFLGAVCSALGPGLGCALVLLAGAGGNLLNALVQGSPHVSVGASTAVFGAVGVLSGLGVSRRLARRSWVPLAAGLAILAMLGTGGARVDLWAHLFGLVVGVALGIPIGFAVPRPPSSSVQWILGSAALGGVLYCWTLALR